MIEDPDQNTDSSQRRRRKGSSIGWFLLIGIVIAVVMQRPSGPKLMAEDAYQQMTERRLTIIDVRDPSEWLQTGIGRGVEPISMHRRDGVEGFIEAVKETVNYDLSRPVALICATGNRSRAMQFELLDAGFLSVFDIAEGMQGGFTEKGWIAKGLPVDGL